MLYIALLTLLLFLSYFFFALQAFKRQLRGMQQGGYQFEPYVELVKAQRKAKTEGMWVLVASIAINLLARDALPILYYYLLHILAFTVLGLAHLRGKKEPGPVLDLRMTRLIAAGILLFLLLLLALGLLFRRTFWWELPFVVTFLGFFSDIWILLANALLRPLENRKVDNRLQAAGTVMTELAKQRADAGKPPLITVGVSGSMYQTNFIELLGQLMETRSQVLRPQPGKAVTPESVEALIREKLSASHDLLLVEIASTRPGDVRRFCAQLQPDLGVITGVAEGGISGFATPALAAEAHMELADCLRGREGLLALNYADEQLRKQKAEGLPLMRYGLHQGGGTPSHLDIWAADADFGLDGTRFTLYAKGQPALACRIALPGSLSLLHCVGAAGLALRLGMTPDELVPALAALAPREGFLRLLPAGQWPAGLEPLPAPARRREEAEAEWPDSLRILDDSRQKTLEGAKDSLGVLRDCQGPRILLTPGLKGQGEQEEEFNRRLGRQAARCCDQMVVIGKDAVSAIADGAGRAGFAGDDVHPALDLKDALAKASALAQEAAAGNRPVYLLALGQFD